MQILLLLVVSVISWPGLRKKGRIGPDCTIGAHNEPVGKCPNMAQPPPPSGSKPPHSLHSWPEHFMIHWEMYFVLDNTDAPPYTPKPSSAYNVTRGKTWYTTINSELRNMRESYESFCIPVFGDPTSSMGSRNDYSCDFINVGSTNISYVITHSDRPKGVPECCIIGQPFHAPPRTFHHNMPVRWAETVSGVLVDWGAVFDKDAGIFNYGFTSDSIPFAFYMKGVPWIANWMWQPFQNFTDQIPPQSTWNIPPSCSNATRCPGW